MRYELKSDEMDVGRRKSDNSPWIKLYFGEYESDKLGELFKIAADDRIYNIILEVEDE